MALRREGAPSAQNFTLDVELWPLERRPERQRMILAFREWCNAHSIQLLDQLDQETIVLYRVLLAADGLEALLNHRDVRQTDLPPKYQLNLSLLGLELQSIPDISAPNDGAAGVVVLDSGLTTNHPLLAPAIGDSQSFVDGLGAEDEHGHGTMVGGIALYGDFEKLAENGRFSPLLRLFSGRITNEQNENSSNLVERHIEEAVRYFTSNYGCKVFSLSFGDARKPFEEGHVRGLAAVLDSLARLHNVLFVVSAGNFTGNEDSPLDWRAEYPHYLLRDEARILDPAPGLNLLTVGSLARYEVPRMGQRFPNDPAYQAIARRDQPSPFSRSGPGPGGAIKPEVVEYGGNQYVDLRTGQPTPRGLTELGELGPSRNFAGGKLFSIDSGTSYAAPKVAHLAGRLLSEYPTASPNLLRALIVAHSRQPFGAAGLLGENEQSIYQLFGYGKPDHDSALFSNERNVTLVHEDRLGENQHHFYQIPLPEDFFRPPARRARKITVALAHTPFVRRTRFEYRASTFQFRVVRSKNIHEIVSIFRRTSPEEREELIPEAGNFRPKGQRRSKGTVQAAHWDIRQVDSRWQEQSLFLIVTRTVPTWAHGLSDREPYAVTAVVEDQSTEQVRYYTQLAQRLRVPRIRL
ncbi:MAG TPA: S8 family peptidase [Thermoanaerobaculia bacterium]|nr:S8 family peptidase [Thermoanaerobaculia bacterium]